MNADLPAAAGAIPVRIEVWHLRTLGGPLEAVAIEDRGAWVIPLGPAAGTEPEMDPDWTGRWALTGAEIEALCRIAEDPDATAGILNRPVRRVGPMTRRPRP